MSPVEHYLEMEVKMAGRLSRKVAVVTGASAGIGAECVHALAAEAA